MSGALGALLDLLFPPRCVFCRRLLHRGEEDICPRCQQELPWALGAEAEQTGEFFSLCASPLWYQDQVRASFHRYKFKGVRGYSRTYGRLVAQCVQDHLAGRYDLITWVPLSRARLRQRGYDQAMLLASAAALALDDVAAETLCKVRDTEAQSGLGKNDASRRANVLSAYQVTDPALVEGRRVLLIDDIVTTGSTLSECARVLRTAGAADVVCAALARSRRSC
ncbi:MAG: phosphoribosyltransferase family protein [Clostridiales bacterium]|uniref:Double zinc ribbon domain-containing protein n=1 Tax=Intestinimonas massiliensis (ex Afouda et al. 2020) TaxID=1673721 RepID=A0AAW5JMK0_9FIRM|nr:phosphoribosyltransferase family protein [Intestinimonas massiliensis (ex Afouda et al. 2020)]MCQ4769094.1 double zinc ribbon domain-containing protein [Intestinimonas massiliensis (ex Afouda et al. 2020)]MDU1323962.1 phosphoribosyltransferase family protein [Clostridiales bacterium]